MGNGGMFPETKKNRIAQHTRKLLDTKPNAFYCTFPELGKK